jgi:transcriptional regulator with XRE-family HTH domain
MALGPLIRDLRNSKAWSQTDLATRLCQVAGRSTLTRDEVKRWESEKVIPGPFWINYLSQALDIPRDVLTTEAKLSRMNRRDFLSLTALTVAHGKLAAEMTASIAGSDFGPLTTVQTTHGTDLVIASLVDKPSTLKLKRWMFDGETPILRVNAAGILAKTPGQSSANAISEVLEHDLEARNLYSTAVAARACAIPWSSASRLASGTARLTQKQAHFIATRLADEVLNPRDAGARWCSAVMLRDLSSRLGQTHS